MGLYCITPAVKIFILMTSSWVQFLTKFLSISLIYHILNITTRGPDNAVQASLIWKPVYTFIQVGGLAELSCRTDLTESITWMQRKLTDGKTHVLYTTHVLYDYKGRKNSDRMNVTDGRVLSGWYNLTIKNVFYNDAGIYTCVDDDNIEGAEQYAVQLAVIGGRGLQCAHNLDVCVKDSHPATVAKITITCSLEYCGNIPPVLLWKRSGMVIAEGIFVHTVNSTTTSLSVTAITLVMRPSQLIESSPLTCEMVLTKFSQHSLSSSSVGSLGFVYYTRIDSAACLPVYNDTCSTNPADLKCSSSSFYWPNDNNALQFDLKVYQVNEQMRNVTDVYYCTQGNITCIPIGYERIDADQRSVLKTVLIWCAVLMLVVMLLLMCLRILLKEKQQDLRKRLRECSPENCLEVRKFLLDNKTITDIGHGRYTAVQKAIHKDWNLQIVCKKLKAETIIDESVKKEFKNQAEFCCNLRHPNIVSIFGVVLEEGNYGLILEDVKYGALDVFMQQLEVEDGNSFAMSTELKLKISSDICSGMSYLHEQQPTPIIHGQLYLHKILVGEQLRVKISAISFSNIIALSPAHDTESEIDTRSSCPDVAASKEWDVYCFGTLFWKLLAEQSGFPTDQDSVATDFNTSDIGLPLLSSSSSKFSRNFTDIGELPRDLPSGVTDVITDCWKKEADGRDRPKFADLVKQLEDFIGTMSKQEQAATEVLRLYHRHPKSNEPLSEHGFKMERVSQQLSDMIRLTSDVMDQLENITVLSCSIVEYVKFKLSDPHTYAITRRLIDKLSSKSPDHYQEFLTILDDSDQQHLHELLEGADQNVDHRTVLIQHYPFLMKYLNVTEILLNALRQSHALNEEEMKMILEHQRSDTKFDNVARLLQFLLRTSHQQYESFLKVLTKSNMWFISETLLGRTGQLLILGLDSETDVTTNLSVHRVNLHDKDSVSLVCQLPAPVMGIWHMQTCASCNYVYIFITYSLSGVDKRELWQLDLITLKWSKCADLKEDRLGHCLVFLHSQLYLLSGERLSSTSSSLECYDIVEKKWSSELIRSMLRATCVPFRDSIYVFGDSDDGEGCVQVYNPATRSSELLDITMPLLESPVQGTCDRRIIALLWEMSVILMRCNNSCIIYNLETQTWLERSPFKVEMSYPGIALHKQTLYVAGGCVGRPTDEIVSVSVQDVIDDKPAVLKHHADLPGRGRAFCLITLPLPHAEC